MYEEKDAWVFLFSFEKAMPVHLISKENRVFQTCHTKKHIHFYSEERYLFQIDELDNSKYYVKHDCQLMYYNQQNHCYQ